VLFNKSDKAFRESEPRMNWSFNGNDASELLSSVTAFVHEAPSFSSFGFFVNVT